MSDVATGTTPEERPDALQRLAADFQERPAFYLGWVAAALVILIGVQIATKFDSGPGEDHFSPVWAAYEEARDRVGRNLPATAELERLNKELEKSRGTNAEASALWLSALAHYGSAFTTEKVSFAERKPDLETALSNLTELQDKKFDYYPTAMSQYFTRKQLNTAVRNVPQSRRYHKTTRLFLR